MKHERNVLLLSSVILALWVMVSMWVGWYATPLIHPDGFQSIGASFGPVKCGLSWPFVGNFEGYAEHWGYHWFGWPMLRAWFSALIPFSPLGDSLFLHIVRALTGLLVALHVQRSYGATSAAMIACGMIMLQKGWFCSMAYLYRPETVGALLLWLAAEPIFHERAISPLRYRISQIALLLSPMFHPLAVAAAGWIAVLGIASERASLKRSWCVLLTRWLLPYWVGLVLMVAYYVIDDKYLQLFATLETMQAVKSSAIEALQNLLFSPNNVFYSLPVIGLTLLTLFAIWKKRVHGRKLFALLATASFHGMAIAYLIAGGHPNVGHAALMTPFLGLWSAQLYLIFSESNTGKKFAPWLSLATLAFCCIPLLLVVLAYAQKMPQSPRRQASHILESALSSTAGQVVIPLSLWEAALMQKPEVRARIRFATFPNYASVERRLVYENSVVASLKEGDILIQEMARHDRMLQNDVYPMPRHAVYHNSENWSALADFSPIENQTILLGSFQKKDLVIEGLQILRYQQP